MGLGLGRLEGRGELLLQVLLPIERDEGGDAQLLLAHQLDALLRRARVVHLLRVRVRARVRVRVRVRAKVGVRVLVLRTTMLSSAPHAVEIATSYSGAMLPSEPSRPMTPGIEPSFCACLGLGSGLELGSGPGLGLGLG